jgi:hypothetical protein
VKVTLIDQGDFNLGGPAQALGGVEATKATAHNHNSMGARGGGLGSSG